MAHEYADLQLARARLDIESTKQNALLTSLLTVSSRAIDEVCGRRFYSATETRYYTPTCATELAIDDLVSVTTLKTDEDGDRTYEITWSSTTDYYLDPPNAASDGRPYSRILVDAANGSYSFPRRYRGVQLIGSFGWDDDARPVQIVEATLILMSRLFKRKDSVMGWMAGGEFAEAVRIAGSDPDMLRLVEPFRIIGVA